MANNNGNNQIITSLVTKKNVRDFKEFFIQLTGMDNKLVLRNDILLLFKDYCKEKRKSKQFREKSALAGFLENIQELFVLGEHIVIMYRQAVARYRYYLLHESGEYMEEIEVAEYLRRKDSYVTGHEMRDTVSIDLMPFYDYSPSIRDAKSIGDGIRFLNRYMSSKIFSNPDEWNDKLFQFIKLHKYKDIQLLVNGKQIRDFDTFYDRLEEAIKWLRGRNEDVTYSKVADKLNKLGFEPGWGNTVGRVVETMQLLIDLLAAPSDSLLAEFISRVPMPLIGEVAIISPHGWLAQENIIGKPDTGGQVVYIFDQVRALEKHLKKEIELSGLEGVTPRIIVLTRLIPEAGDTTCNQRMEKIHHTDNCWILRVPFRDRDYNVVRNWISRFKLWPYLETFAEDAERELLSEFERRPDLIIGNYSDGNLVATLLSDRLDVVQCNIAHALEKTKYLFSDMYWKDFEEDYHFSIQFTADLIAMNKTDFIITSTHQEIIGNDHSMGQYESYQFFTMPGLYRVESGVNLLHPKFNVIPPGVDENRYYPYFDSERRSDSRRDQWEEKLFHDESEDVYGTLEDMDKTPIFTMARMDRIKNITGLIEAFGMSRKLRSRCNLIFAAGTVNPEESQDTEERQEIQKAYDLINHYDLHGKVRWISSNRRLDTGVVYRIIADHRGIFVQPALFEAFGLTVLEAMVSGIPTFATQFGGPCEIIENGRNGFLINTSKPELIREGLEAFFDRADREEDYWDRISRAGIERVRQAFTWANYSQRLVNLTKLYGFWRYSVSGKAKVKLNHYCDMIYHFIYRQRSERM